MSVVVRPMEPRDAQAWAAMRCALFPDADPQELQAEVLARCAGESGSTLPIAAFVAEEEGRPIGFVEVAMRSTVDGCDSRRPAAYLEEWWVAPDARRRGVGAALVRAAEEWATAQGCVEIGSDTLIENEVSQAAHAALGYAVVDRCVNYRKTLAGGDAPAAPAELRLVVLAVDDVTRAVAFYAAALGWRQTVDAAPHYAEFELPGGGTGVGLYQRGGFARTAGAPPAEVPAGAVAPAELYVRGAYPPPPRAKLTAAGAPPLSPRSLRDWGDEAAYFADPDGNVVAVARHGPG